MRRIGRTTSTGLGLVVVLTTALVLAAPARPAPEPGANGWTVATVRFEPLGHPLGAEGMGDYRGVIEVTRDGPGVAVINEVGMDDYLRGIAEMPTRWPIEAQKAQAIAARTYALWQMRVPSSGAFRAAGADICATQACQVYRGLARERDDVAGRWAAAVAATRGQVLLHDGGVIKAMYGSSNGGRSHSGGVSWLPAVDDPDDRAVSPWARWQSVLPLPEVAAAVGVEGDPVEVRTDGPLVVVATAAPDGSRREQAFGRIEFRAVVNRVVPAPPELPVPVLSYRYAVTTVDGAVVVEGEGYGHNLGMSQWGAYGKAHRGLAAADILADYYGGLRPTDVADRMPAVIRVAIGLGRPGATVSADGPFRVLAGDRTVLAEVAHGRWEVRPARGGGVHVMAPPDQLPPGPDREAEVQPGAAVEAQIALLLTRDPACAACTAAGADGGAPPPSDGGRLVPALAAVITLVAAVVGLARLGPAARRPRRGAATLT